MAEPSADLPLYIPNISILPLVRTSHQLTVKAFSVRKKINNLYHMKLTIEIPKHYYDMASENPASLILEVAHTDWKDFAFDMADVVEKALKDQV